MFFNQDLNLFAGELGFVFCAFVFKFHNIFRHPEKKNHEWMDDMDEIGGLVGW